MQIFVFIFITAIIGLLTYLQCRKADTGDQGSGHDYFLANGGLSWYFVAGSITLTNLSTDQLVGMNGNQMLLLAWWELAAVCGLIILAFVFLPIYYNNNCTTTTELLQRKYNDKHIRALISALFLLGNIFIFLPAVLYGGSLFLLSMFDLDIPLMVVAVSLAIVGATYAILGGLRAVAVSDTYSGVLILSLALLVVFLALKAIDFDFSGIPAERLTMIGDNDSPIPWHTLLTGMIFIQTFYWSTNQTITQRAMAAPTLKEARKGVLAAAGIRLMIVPVIVTVPGIVAFKLYGDINDEAYGRLVGDVLPGWLSGAFAAAIAAAALTSFNSILNASAALYVCDLHECYVRKVNNIPKLSSIVSCIMTLLAILLVPVFATQESVINTVQQLFGLLSMPILSAFVVGLAFKGVEARAAIAAVVAGVALYAFLSFVWTPVHYIHAMFITLIFCIAFSLLINRLLGNRATLVIGEKT
ncbi:sodium:solute symporter family transporter [Agarilytica rhodophyticola]|uniref:sodium:solute symporter family transporter n=1 Tax=Agarilytica rhodophyticola TaxID=1737490 RepID=UPI001FE3B07D|nr:sodium/solute symporter [Agarilytica rhodophyticola]